MTKKVSKYDDLVMYIDDLYGQLEAEILDFDHVDSENYERLNNLFGRRNAILELLETIQVHGIENAKS